MKFHASRQHFTGNICLHLVRQVGDEIQAAKPIEFATTKSYEYTEPLLIASQTTAQLLMDELWNCGLRPTEGSGSAGALAATQKHLDDMRRLVFADAPASITPFKG